LCKGNEATQRGSKLEDPVRVKLFEHIAKQFLAALTEALKSGREPYVYFLQRRIRIPLWVRMHWIDYKSLSGIPLSNLISVRERGMIVREGTEWLGSSSDGKNLRFFRIRLRKSG